MKPPPPRVRECSTMNQFTKSEEIMKMTTEIVVAYLGQRSVEPGQLSALVSSVKAALTEEPVHSGALTSGSSAQGDEKLECPVVEASAPEQPNGAARPVHHPAVPVEQSISESHLVCLEDGLSFRSLKRHLGSAHGLTPVEYRKKWDLPASYPMVAPSYSEDRSAVAKRIGLGLSRAAAKRSGASRGGNRRQKPA